MSLEWMEQAHCITADLELFFSAQWREAVAICRGCPVRSECLEYALSFPEAEDYGVFGGLSQHQRILLRRERRKRASKAYFSVGEEERKAG